MTASDDGLTGIQAFNLALRMAIDASADHVAANARADTLKAELYAVALSRDAMRNERDRLRDRVVAVTAGEDKITALYKAADEARKLLQQMSTSQRRKIRTNTIATTSANLGNAMRQAEPYVDLIPF